MSGINTNYQATSTYKYSGTTKTGAAETEAAKESSTTSSTTTTAAKEDTFVKSSDYKPDMEKVNSMKADLNNKMGAFKQMVQGLFQKQGGYANSALSSLMNIDKATQDSAKAAISEDGEWGVEATATRILDFAKALSGGDPDKIESLRNAVEKGFKAAEKVWGGTLPGISYETYDRVMKGFDDWAKESTSSATATSNAAATIVA